MFLNVRRASYDVGLGSRVARLTKGGAIGVFGALLMGESVNTAQQAVFMTDSSGLLAGARAPGGRQPVQQRSTSCAPDCTAAFAR